MTKRMHLYSGEERIGVVHKSGKTSHVVMTGPTRNNDAIVYIKLPRRVVHACERNSARSEAFSHAEEIAGRQAIIYTTGDRKGFCIAYAGIIDEVSSNGLRQFVLTQARKIGQSEWNACHQASTLTKE